MVGFGKLCVPLEKSWLLPRYSKVKNFIGRTLDKLTLFALIYIIIPLFSLLRSFNKLEIDNAGMADPSMANENRINGLIQTFNSSIGLYCFVFISDQPLKNAIQKFFFKLNW